MSDPPPAIYASPPASAPPQLPEQHEHDQPRRSDSLAVPPALKEEGGASSASSASPSGEGTKSLHTRRKSSHFVKETLNAESVELADGRRQLNDYVLGPLLGQGAFGTVELALDTRTGRKYAVKEFSKMRLRKQTESALLRRMGPGARRGRGRGGGRGGGAGVEGEGMGRPVPERKDSLGLIRHEIALMEKLDHPHCVHLYEVLDDPSQDSLYMVMEYCPGGPLMNVEVGRPAAPPLETARHWFRQIILGVEYLHENGIAHRDIKPDNILLSSDRQTCLIADFGVSELFDKPSSSSSTSPSMQSAGSPAFLSPELCVPGHGPGLGVGGDVWAMGVTLYCLVTGRLPWDNPSILDLFEEIKNEPAPIPHDLPTPLKDLFAQLLEKDPGRRISIAELREDPWVTDDGREPLISREENLLAVVEEVTEEEIESAIKSINSIFTVIRAVQKLRRLTLTNKRSLSSGDEPPASSASLGRSTSTSASASASDASDPFLSSPPPPVLVASPLAMDDARASAPPPPDAHEQPVFTASPPSSPVASPRHTILLCPPSPDPASSSAASDLFPPPPLAPSPEAIVATAAAAMSSSSPASSSAFSPPSSSSSPALAHEEEREEDSDSEYVSAVDDLDVEHLREIEDAAAEASDGLFVRDEVLREAREVVEAAAAATVVAEARNGGPRS